MSLLKKLKKVKRCKAMKKVIAIMMAAVMLMSFCGCKSQAEREYERAARAAKSASDAYEHAKRNYDDFNKAVENYERAKSRLG